MVTVADAGSAIPQPMRRGPSRRLLGGPDAA